MNGGAGWMTPLKNSGWLGSTLAALLHPSTDRARQRTTSCPAEIATRCKSSPGRNRERHAETTRGSYPAG